MNFFLGEYRDINKKGDLKIDAGADTTDIFANNNNNSDVIDIIEIDGEDDEKIKTLS